MSRQEDVIFCKIAIANGLITEEVAHKALSLCEKREQETGRRPLIGAVFNKHGLMQPQDVQRIYGAVQKRLGTSVGPQKVPPRSKEATVRIRESKVLRQSKILQKAAVRRGVDPQTLWFGIGGLLVFVGLLVVMFIYVIMPPAKKVTEGAATAEAAPLPGSAPAAPKTASAATPTPVDSKAATGEISRGLPRELQAQVDEGLMTANEFRTDDPKRGLELLERMEKQLRDKGYEPPQKLLDGIKEFRQAAQGGGASAPAPAPAPAPEAAPKAEAPQPKQPPATPATPPEKKEAPSEDDLEKELLGGQ